MTKIVAVVTSSQPFAVVANAVAHASLGLAAQLAESGCPLPLTAIKDTQIAPDHGMVDVELELRHANSQEELRYYRSVAIEKGLQYVDFTQTMTGETYLEQIQKTKSFSTNDLEYYCVVIAGEVD